MACHPHLGMELKALKFFHLQEMFLEVTAALFGE